jgi:hypothetical protein
MLCMNDGVCTEYGVCVWSLVGHKDYKPDLCTRLRTCTGDYLRYSDKALDLFSV